MALINLYIINFIIAKFTILKIINILQIFKSQTILL